MSDSEPEDAEESVSVCIHAFCAFMHVSCPAQIRIEICATPRTSVQEFGMYPFVHA
jgi:hypothetical protein